MTLVLCRSLANAPFLKFYLVYLCFPILTCASFIFSCVHSPHFHVWLFYMSFLSFPANVMHPRVTVMGAYFNWFWIKSTETSLLMRINKHNSILLIIWQLLWINISVNIHNFDWNPLVEWLHLNVHLCHLNGIINDTFLLWFYCEFLYQSRLNSI